jgi:hypothetical protein
VVLAEPGADLVAHGFDGFGLAEELEGPAGRGHCLAPAPGGPHRFGEAVVDLGEAHGIAGGSLAQGEGALEGGNGRVGAALLEGAAAQIEEREGDVGVIFAVELAEDRRHSLEHRRRLVAAVAVDDDAGEVEERDGGRRRLRALGLLGAGEAAREGGLGLFEATEAVVDDAEAGELASDDEVIATVGFFEKGQGAAVKIEGFLETALAAADLTQVSEGAGSDSIVAGGGGDVDAGLGAGTSPRWAWTLPTVARRRLRSAALSARRSTSRAAASPQVRATSGRASLTPTT